nr:MAG: ORF1 [TTV-like mini virus]UGV38794.1 MAG: ORF1 [TTV-like mini virus]
MPWRNYYRYRRRYWNRYRRPRKIIWRRRRRRTYWKRRRNPVRRKLKSLILRTYQPQTIRKCKIKGFIPLFWGPVERMPHNYELYEMAIAPEKIPSGGLFSIKNFTLEALYAENKYLRNIWTHSNNNLPLMRFCGAKIKCYRSLHIDYILSYGTSLPMGANLQTYQSMHPGIHGMIKNKIMVARKRDNYYRKPYITFKTKPPDPLINKWYFQQDMAKIPLLQIRSSASSFDQYYTDYRAISTTINIFYLNIGLIQNSNFKRIPTSGYSPRQQGGDKIYLYHITTKTLPSKIPIQTIIFLGNTNKNQPGKTIPSDIDISTLNKYPEADWGNPFYKTYLQKDTQIYMSTKTLSYLINNKENISNTFFTQTHMLEATRYNPFRDQGTKNKIWLQSIKEDSDGWNPPQAPSIYLSEYLPLWCLAFGFEDFQKKNNRVTSVDTDYMVVLQTNYDKPTIVQTLPIIDVQFIQGKSPYEDGPSPLDADRWYPSLQMQQTSITAICSSGPGSPKQAPLNNLEAKIEYCFYFKWGGNPPPMDTITDPKDQPEIHIPTNLQQTNSLQNPANDPAMYLYNFDERRNFLTKSAIKRLQKDYKTKTTFVTDGSLFQAPIQAQEDSSEETTSEEEEETENLLLKLQQQRRKHKLLRMKIMEKLGILPT